MTDSGFVRRVLLVGILVGASGLQAQHVVAPMASVVDVAARQALLKSTTDPKLRSAIEDLGSCVKTPLIAAPGTPIEIPHHYLSGSHGPTNPAEGEATKVYVAFENRLVAGMNQYVATGSLAEAACALDQLDAWAKGKALLEYDAKASTQAWFQVGWTLCSAGIADSVL